MSASIQHDISVVVQSTPQTIDDSVIARLRESRDRARAERESLERARAAEHEAVRHGCHQLGRDWAMRHADFEQLQRAAAWVKSSHYRPAFGSAGEQWISQIVRQGKSLEPSAYWTAAIGIAEPDHNQVTAFAEGVADFYADVESRI